MSLNTKIENEDILMILTNPQNRDILIYLIAKPRSISEIGKKFMIPKSTVYRRIMELRNAGLVNVVSSIINVRGRRTYLYMSRINKINISLSNDGLDINIERNNLKYNTI
ncbi:MAG: winged helix-turn-helix domain-containing protein [Candidatus Nitrosocaldaceae archaeon]